MLVGRRLQLLRPRVALAEQAPVDRAAGAARAHEVVAAELVADDVVAVLPADVLDVAPVHLRPAAREEEVVELVAADGMLRGAELEGEPLDVGHDLLEGEKAPRVVGGVEGEVRHRLRGDPSRAELGARELLPIEDRDLRAALHEARGAGGSGGTAADHDRVVVRQRAQLKLQSGAVGRPPVDVLPGVGDAVVAAVSEHDLEELNAARQKGGRAAAEVEAPGPDEGLVVPLAHGGHVGVEALEPLHQGLRVVQAEVLDVDDRELVALEYRHHLAQARRIAPGEDALLEPRVHRRGPAAPDAVHDPEPVFLQAPRDHLAERLVVVGPDVLEHADRDECVVLSADVPVVVLDELDPGGKPRTLGPLLRVGDLLVRDVEGAHPDSVVARHVQRQRTPAAARLHHLLAGLETHLAAHVVHLRLLGLLQGGLGVLVVGAGVDHALVEPQPVEVVAQVVVVADVLAGAARRVLSRPREAAQDRLLERGARLFLHRAIGPVQHVDEVALDLDAARAVAVPEPELRGADDGPQRPAVPDDDAPRRLPFRRPGILSVPQREAQGRVSRFLHDPARKPPIERIDARTLRPRSRPGDARAITTRHPQRMLAVSAHSSLPRSTNRE